MLKKLRRKFTAITTLLVCLVLAAVLGSSIYSSELTQRDIVMGTLEQAIENGVSIELGGESPESRNGDLMLTVVVDVSADGATLEKTSLVANISDEVIERVVAEALASEESTGSSEEYSIAWMKAKTARGWRIALVDTYQRMETIRSQALNSLGIFLLSALVVLFVSYGLSGLALRPVKLAWDQQRQFVSDASHELKTPLAVILANTQILKTMSGMPPEAARWVASTADEAGQMKRLVEDLLTLARSDEQQSEQSAGRDEVDLSGLVERCALEFDPVAFDRGCSIESAVAPGLVVLGDRDQLARLVRTLVDNATKYAREGTAASVSLARDGRRARLVVNNLGDPIAPEDLEHLFDRFYRTDKARERKGAGGFGLGLAIARSITEAHGGKIAVTSTAEAGTTFTVSLPLASGPSGAGFSGGAPAAPPSPGSLASPASSASPAAPKPASPSSDDRPRLM